MGKPLNGTRLLVAGAVLALGLGIATPASADVLSDRAQAVALYETGGPTMTSEARKALLGTADELP